VKRGGKKVTVGRNIGVSNHVVRRGDVFSVACLFVCVTVSVGCNKPAASSAAGPSASPVAVDTAIATSERIVEYREFTGRTAAVNSVEIRPRVSGYLLQTPVSDPKNVIQPAGEAVDVPVDLTKFHDVVDSNYGDKSFIVKVREGELVQEGAPLFEVDPEPYRLAYEQAVGKLEAAKGQLVQARRQQDRLKTLASSNAASQAEFDVAIAAASAAAGTIDQLKAAVDSSYLQWQYTQVRSPIAGLLGRTQLTRGNLVIADTTILATVVSVDPIYVNFTVDENSLLDYQKRISEGTVQSARNSVISIDMALSNEVSFDHHGVIDFVDNVTDPETGNTQVRARFENKDRRLSPGYFARIRAPFTAPYDAVLIPTIAIGADQQGRYVMVIDEAIVVHRRAIETGNQRESTTVIKRGIEAGETVVTIGLQKVRDGAPVALAKASTTTPQKQPTEPAK